MSKKSKLNRLNIRFKFGNVTIFFMVALTQTLKGISSKIEWNKHIILWDLDKCNITQAERALRDVQDKYNLSDIHIFSDRNDGFCAICFKQVTYIELLRIIIDTQYIDVGFISYTAKRNKATLRMLRKEGRPELKILSTLKTYSIPLPDNMEFVTYDTGLVKDGISLGVKD
jgi:hypothetical protein